MTTRSSSASQASVIVPARNSSSIGCSSGSVSSRSRGHGRDDGLAARGRHHLVEQLVDPLGEHRDLLLLQRDADQRAAAAGLQEEGALPGLADRAGDEALGRVEAVDDGHAATLGPGRRRLRPGAAAHRGVAARPAVAALRAASAAAARTGRRRGC